MMEQSSVKTDQINSGSGFFIFILASRFSHRRLQTLFGRQLSILTYMEFMELGSLNLESKALRKYGPFIDRGPSNNLHGILPSFFFDCTGLYFEVVQYFVVRLGSVLIVKIVFAQSLQV